MIDIHIMLQTYTMLLVGVVFRMNHTNVMCPSFSPPTLHRWRLRKITDEVLPLRHPPGIA